MQIVVGRKTGLVEIGRGLFQGQRQVTEFRCKCVGLLTAQLWSTAAQQANRIHTIKQIKVQYWADSSKPTPPRGDQHVSVAARKKWPDVLDALGVVEHQ